MALALLIFFFKDKALKYLNQFVVKNLEMKSSVSMVVAPLFTTTKAEKALVFAAIGFMNFGCCT